MDEPFSLHEMPVNVRWCSIPTPGDPSVIALRWSRNPMDLLAHQNKSEQVHGDTNYPIEGFQVRQISSPGLPVQALAEDHIGSYIPPFPCERMDGE